MGHIFRRHREGDAATIQDEEEDGLALVAPSGADAEELPPAERSWRQRRSVRVFMVASLLLVVAGGITFAGSQILMSRYVGSVHQEPLLGGAAAIPLGEQGSGTTRPDPPLNLLLVGIDDLAVPGNGARSDTIIVLHIPAGHDRAYLISIPRDSRVDVPAFPKTGYPGGTDKINAAFAYGFSNKGGRPGGFELLALTIKQLTGISFNAGAILNFDGLRKVVDEVGGVDMCVDEQTPVARMGCQSFTGAQALTYVRERMTMQDGDYARQRHQQQLVMAVAKKIASTGTLADPFAADRALRAMGDAVTFDGNGTSLQDWVSKLKSINPDTMKMVKTNGGRYNAQMIDGQSFEILTDATRSLFAATRDDTLDAFIAAHPDWATSAKQ